MQRSQETINRLKQDLIELNCEYQKKVEENNQLEVLKKERDELQQEIDEGTAKFVKIF